MNLLIYSNLGSSSSEESNSEPVAGPSGLVRQSFSFPNNGEDESENEKLDLPTDLFAAQHNRRQVTDCASPLLSVEERVMPVISNSEAGTSVSFRTMRTHIKINKQLRPRRVSSSSSTSS